MSPQVPSDLLSSPPNVALVTFSIAYHIRRFHVTNYILVLYAALYVLQYYLFVFVYVAIYICMGIMPHSYLPHNVHVEFQSAHHSINIYVFTHTRTHN